MTIRTFTTKATLAILIATIATGCATTGSTPDNVNATHDSAGCDPTIAAGVGALLGGLLASGNNRVKGAALGASLSAFACVAWNYNSQQTKTAEQVQKEYKTTNNKTLPPQSQVVTYTTRFDPNSKVVPGKPLTLASSIEVIQGSAETVAPVIEEEMVVVKPDGSEIKARKRANEGKGAGGYQTTFTMNLPAGIPQGDYPVRTSLYLNGKAVAQKQMSMQVVSIASNNGFIAMAK